MPKPMQAFLASASMEVDVEEPYYVLPTLSSTKEGAERIWKRLCEDEDSIASALVYHGVYEVVIIVKRKTDD